MYVDITFVDTFLCVPFRSYLTWDISILDFPPFKGGMVIQELAKTKADAQVHQSLGTALGRSILDWMDSCVVCLFFLGTNNV